MTKYYKYKNKQTEDINEVRKWFPYMSLPINLNDEDLLNLLNVTTQIVEDVFDLEAYRLAKRKEIWDAGDAELAYVKLNFTQAEIESWSKQEEGAEDILNGKTDTAAAEFVATIAYIRQIDTLTLVNKIKKNVVSYGKLSSAVIGQQQRLDTMVTNATSKEELDEIIWAPILGVQS